jgi:hypothetical protein
MWAAVSDLDDYAQLSPEVPAGLESAREEADRNEVVNA